MLDIHIAQCPHNPYPNKPATVLYPPKLSSIPTPSTKSANIFELYPPSHPTSRNLTQTTTSRHNPYQSPSRTQFLIYHSMPNQSNPPRRTTRTTRFNPPKRSQRLTLHLRKKKVTFNTNPTKKRKARTVAGDEGEAEGKGKTNTI